jgi:hypothetical protein
MTNNNTHSHTFTHSVALSFETSYPRTFLVRSQEQALRLAEDFPQLPTAITIAPFDPAKLGSDHDFTVVLVNKSRVLFFRRSYQDGIGCYSFESGFASGLICSRRLATAARHADATSDFHKSASRRDCGRRYTQAIEVD